MATDDTKLNYSSGWDIDQLVASAAVAVSSGTTAIYTIPATLPATPEFEVQFKPAASARYHQAGYYSTDGTLAGGHQFSSYVQGSQVFITTDIAGTARYYVWSDKVDY